MDPNVISATEKAQRDEQLKCRFYGAQYPEVDECVMVLVKHIADMGAYVSLIEYGDIEGMILLSELSRRRIRSINKLIRVGKLEVAMVMRVDKQKGYIDLSRRRVTQEDVIKCEERFSKGKAVNSIMRHVAELSGKKLVELNEKISWPLEKKFGNSYEGLRSWMAGEAEIEAEDEVKQILMKIVKKKLAPQPVRVRADLNITCFSEEGIDVIKAALEAGENLGASSNAVTIPEEKQPDGQTEDKQPNGEALTDELKIKLIAPPLYVLMLSSKSHDKESAIALANEAIARVKNVLEEKTRSSPGTARIEIKEAPRVTSNVEDNQLREMIKNIELENREVAGDDDDEEEEAPAVDLEK